MSIGTRIKHIRKECNMTQAQFAEAIGMKQSPLSQIESDKILPSIETLKTIRRKFNIPYDYIIDGSSENTHESMTVLDEKTKNTISHSFLNELIALINKHQKTSENLNPDISSLKDLESFIQNIVDKRLTKLETTMNKLLSTVDQKIFEEDLQTEIEKSNQRLEKGRKSISE